MGDEKAIGLSYDGSAPPKLDFKLTGQQAREVVAQARELGLLVHEDQGLLASLEQLAEGEEIPAALYQIVAELIAFAWLLMGKEPEYWRTPDGGIRGKS